MKNGLACYFWPEKFSPMTIEYSGIAITADCIKLMNMEDQVGKADSVSIGKDHKSEHKLRVGST